MTKLNEFEKTHAFLRGWLQGREYHQTLEAVEFAERYHTGTRKDGVTPEFYHQISIVLHLTTLLSGVRESNREAVLTAAVLHDLCEDYDVSTADVEARFSAELAEIVARLSKYTTDGEQESSLAKTPELYYGELSLCPVASIVKGADRVNNFQTMAGVLSKDKQISYMDECDIHIIPMLKKARKLFPDQQPVYENLKFSLKSQMSLIKGIHAAEQGAIEVMKACI